MSKKKKKKKKGELNSDMRKSWPRWETKTRSRSDGTGGQPTGVEGYPLGQQRGVLV